MANQFFDNSVDKDVVQHTSHIKIVARNKISPRPVIPSRPKSAEHLGSETGSSEYSSSWVRSRKVSSDSGTDADDERNGGLSRGSPTSPTKKPGLGPDDGSNERLEISEILKTARKGLLRRLSGATFEAAYLRERRRKTLKLEVWRRVCETLSVFMVAASTFMPENVSFVAGVWSRELRVFIFLTACLYALLPLRIYLRRFHWSVLRNIAFFPFSRNFDPAPLIYPLHLPVLVALSLGKGAGALVLPNIMLGLASLPPYSVPLQYMVNGYSVTHWMVTLIPLLASEYSITGDDTPRALSLHGLEPESLVLYFPLHQASMSVVQSLVKSSLLPAEVPLLTTLLLNSLLFAESPQAEISKAIFWLGGLCIFISCRHVLTWEMMLSRIPSWKFRRPSQAVSRPETFWSPIDRFLCDKVHGALKSGYQSQSEDSDAWHVSANPKPEDGPGSTTEHRKSASTADEDHCQKNDGPDSPIKRHQSAAAPSGGIRTTPSGRRKRSQPELRPFLSLTLVQAEVRKWAYAAFAYLSILLIILFPVRIYIAQNALRGHDPFGWAIGYLLGNIPSLRFWLVMSNLDAWACLPPWSDSAIEFCRLGFVDHTRRDFFGEANTRLILCAYCLLVLSIGIALVIRLSKVVEVDTRRKIFHGMMVIMFLPTTYIDPAFTALAMTLILAVFLLLELVRASQLPPLSKPISHFLAPYTDGRDYSGPVIVSHIFLLIGCAIPLWLSLAGAPRTGDGPWAGWEIIGRDVSMVSGVVCVGMGDAAASLVGRRYGKHRWFWGGDKSLEGSSAFAAAVFVGLIVARVWLVIGGWSNGISIPTTLFKATLAAAGSSFTEAVLTGGNDNVVVPLVLWLLVRGMEI